MNRPSDAFSSEMDYLWQAVGAAQDAEARSETERSKARTGMDQAAARVKHLEKELERGAARERQLRDEAVNLKAALARDAETLAMAARQAEEVRGAVKNRAAFEEQLRRNEGEAALLRTEIEGLRAETATLRQALKGREETIEAFKTKISGLTALPELARILKEDGEVSGQPQSAYGLLLERLEHEKRVGAASAAKVRIAAAAEMAAAAEKMEAAENELRGLRSELAQKRRDLTDLEKAMAETSAKLDISKEEQASLDLFSSALKAALAERETALEKSASDCAALRRELEEANARAKSLGEEAAAQTLRTEEQRKNFAGAVNQVFELQQRAAALRLELADAKAVNSDLSAGLEAGSASLEKVNGLLREAKTSLGQEKEISRRAAIKIRSLEAEMEGFRTKIAEAGEYSARLLRAVEERDRSLGSLKTELKKVEALELENDDLRRRNVRFSGVLMREQADFAARVIGALEKAAKDLKNFNVRLPAADRKGLEPAMKNLLSSVNLMKGWQEYMDPEIPEFEDTDLSVFVTGEVGKWEKAFKQRKISVSAAIATPRLRSRLSPERMKMLIYHLVKNAYERLPSGGSLRVTLKGSEDAARAVISFEDNGPGFSRETLEKLFAPFNTTDKGKAGIGLAVARRIAEKHGGTLAVSNKKDRGALVEVSLPLGATAP
jgi:signal transduction histidine kinase